MAEKVFMQVPKILVPKPEFRKNWAVVACDQYTSEPHYWDSVKKQVGDAPSMLDLILPELYLDHPEEEKMIENIIENMKTDMAKEIFTEEHCCVYLERKTRLAPCRRGLLVALDLEAYNFHSHQAPAPIRPTEMTIVERIPPRLRVRSRALIESPHILVLIDDPKREIIEPLTAEKASMDVLYDEELMLGAGHITGYRVKPESFQRIVQLIEKLGEPAAFEAKYGVPAGTPPLLYAVGDGNHSLATAKQSWENIKEQKKAEGKLEEAMKSHPARFCLIELSNIFDEGIEFEPIHRVLFDTKKSLTDALREKYGQIGIVDFPSLAELKKAVEDPMPHFPACCAAKAAEHATAGAPCQPHAFGYVTAKGYQLVFMPAGSSLLPVGTVQTFLDTDFKKEYGKIDFIHGDDVVESLIKADPEHNVGIMLPTMKKDLLFPTVIKNDRLPRKTFSMGEADEKRFYYECRKIVE